MKVISILVSLLLVSSLFSGPLAAAEKSDTFKAEELDQMLAPIALYPDSLLAQVLMASTYPADVSEAAKWSATHPDQQGDAAVGAVSDQTWDPSVKSLVAFPQVLATMDQDPDWVQNVGDAFLAQPEAVMNSVQRLRSAAHKQGNLESNEQQKVVVEEAPQTQQSVIVIEPADPQVVYVPTYNPTVVYGPWWYPHYPPVYLPPPPGYVFGTALVSGIAFGIGVGITNSLWGGCSWHRHEIDINVNRYNNININKKIDINRKNVTWNHNADHRRGVPYRDAKSRARHGKTVAGSNSRQAYRGKNLHRDASREQARSALEKRGMDPAKGRQKLRNDPKTRERARTAAQNVDRRRTNPSARQRSRDHALRGATHPDRTRQQIKRGRASRQSMQRSIGGARRRGGRRRG
jgi:hypothetical protein